MNDQVQDAFYEELHRVFAEFLRRCDDEVKTEVDGLLWAASHKLAAMTFPLDNAQALAIVRSSRTEDKP